MLQVEAVALGDLAIDGLLDPCDLVDQGVAVSIHHLDGESILGVDDPDEQKAVLLQLVESEQLLDALVRHVIVGDGDTARRVGSGELPWRVAGNDVEETPISVFELGLRQPVEESEALRVADLLAKRNGPELLDITRLFDDVESIVVQNGRRHVLETECLCLSIRVLFDEELLLESGDVLVDLFEQGRNLVLLLWQVVNEDVLLLAVILSASQVGQLIDLVIVIRIRLKHRHGILVGVSVSLDFVPDSIYGDVQSGLFKLLLREDVFFVGDLLLAFDCVRLAIKLLTEVRILLVFAVFLV